MNGMKVGWLRLNVGGVGAAAAAMGPARRKAASFLAYGNVTPWSAADRTAQDDWTASGGMSEARQQQQSAEIDQQRAVYPQTGLTLLSRVAWLSKSQCSPEYDTINYIFTCTQKLTGHA